MQINRINENTKELDVSFDILNELYVKQIHSVLNYVITKLKNTSIVFMNKSFKFDNDRTNDFFSISFIEKKDDTNDNYAYNYQMPILSKEEILNQLDVVHKMIIVIEQNISNDCLQILKTIKQRKNKGSYNSSDEKRYENYLKKNEELLNTLEKIEKQAIRRLTKYSSFLSKISNEDMKKISFIESPQTLYNYIWEYYSYNLVQNLEDIVDIRKDINKIRLYMKKKEMDR